MATRNAPTATSVARGNSIHSSLGTLAPLNTPTRRFYGIQDQKQSQEPGVSNPNVYVVQPFKNAGAPKDLILSKKNLPNPGENLLNSTIKLINHFTSCYEAVKQQLQDEHTKERESVLVSRLMIMPGTNNNFSRNTIHQSAKKARLRPLILHQNEQNQNDHHGPSIENCVGISPLSVTKADDLAKIYDEKLRLLRKLRPELFDNQGNLLSHNNPRSTSFSSVSAPSSKKSVTSSFRTPYNTILTTENIPFDERRTFLTEFTNEEEDNENESKNPINELVKNNYVLKVLDIKALSTSSASSKRDQTKSASDKGTHSSHKGYTTTKQT